MFRLAVYCSFGPVKAVFLFNILVLVWELFDGCPSRGALAVKPAFIFLPNLTATVLLAVKKAPPVVTCSDLKFPSLLV